MRNKIIKIIEEKNRKLNAVDIIKELKEEYTVEELKDLIEELDSMCSDGILRTANGNSYVKNEYITGTVDMHEKGNAHVIIPNHEDVFIRRDKMKGANDKDFVSINITDERKNEGEIIKVLKRSLGKSIAEVVNVDGQLQIVPLDKNLPYRVIVEDTDINLVDGLYVHLNYIKDITKGSVLTRIDKVLGHKNALVNEANETTEIASNIAKIACEFGLELEFNEEVLEEAKKMPKELSREEIDKELKKGREDFRNDLIFTIDGKDTKDIDDAISIKILSNGNYELGVHIADVAHYIKNGSALWNTAAERGNSNYLGNKVIPMLPVELSNGICSLNPNEDRFTTSCIMEINHSGEVVNRRIVKGIIKSRKKMNYDAVEDILEDKETEDTKGYDYLTYIVKQGETIDSIALNNNMTIEELKECNKDVTFEEGSLVNVPVRKILKNMHVLSKVLKANKQRRGELEFESDERKYHFDENDRVTEIIAREQRSAEKLIEDFMIVANETVAKFFEEECLPFVYRIHGTPSPKKMDEYIKFLELQGIHYNGVINTENLKPKDCQQLLNFLKDKETFKMLNKKMLRSMQKAEYATTNIGHFGIASECYTHFTSPIRRMSDLLVHTCIDEYLINENLDNRFIERWAAYLTTVCEHISECERNSEKCEYAVEDFLNADYMTDHIGEEYEATIDSLMTNSFFVQTDNFIDGRVDIVLRDEKMVPVSGIYDYNENVMAFTKNGRPELRYGDRVLVKCTNANPEKREIDFALVRKL